MQRVLRTACGVLAAGVAVAMSSCTWTGTRNVAATKTGGSSFSKTAGTEGYILSEGHDGVVLTSIPQGKKQVLVKSHWEPTKSGSDEWLDMRAPAYDAESGTLYYVDEKLGRIMSCRGGKAHEVAYDYSHQGKIREIDWLLVVPKRKKIYYDWVHAGDGQEGISELDMETKKVRGVFGEISVQQAALVDDGHMLICAAPQPAPGDRPRLRGDCIASLYEGDLRTGKMKQLAVEAVGAWFALSASKTKLCVESREGRYVVYEYPSLKALQRTERKVPRDMGLRRVSFAGDRYLLEYQGYGMKLGYTYLVDLEAPGTPGRRLMQDVLTDVQYLPEGMWMGAEKGKRLGRK